MFDKIVSARIMLRKEECCQSISDFYDLIATKLGYNSEKVRYDCTKISVSKPVQDQIFEFYRTSEHMTTESIGQLWLQYGPKANLPHNTYMVDVQKGFIEEV